MKRLQLYYHFPFCLSKCIFCAFYSKPAVSKDVINQYIGALIRQTAAFAAECRSEYEISSVYFGGGTPTVAGAESLISVLNAVKSNFRLTDNAEITLEANPRTVSYDELSKLRNAGFNRLSLGAQSFNNATLSLLRRAHTAEDFVCSFEEARKAGFDNISADLIFALPEETTQMLMHSVRSLIKLNPEHISVYGLSIEKGTPLWKQRAEFHFPNEDEEEEQYYALCRELSDAGYCHYEISNFSKPGCESRHNTGYWKRVPYFGFGAAAHSFFRDRRFSAPPDTEQYINKSKNGCFAPTDYECSVPIGPEEAASERIMLGLRLAEGIVLDKPVPQYVFDNGLAVCKNGRFCLTEKGFRVSNAIIASLI